MNLPMLSRIALGGALGALARYGLGGWVQQLSGGTFPWGTWVINVAGSLFLGLVIRLFEGLAVDPAWRGFLAIGVAGGFTTFSTFSHESLKLLQDGEVPSALLHMAGSVGGGAGGAGRVPPGRLDPALARLRCRTDCRMSGR